MRLLVFSRDYGMRRLGVQGDETIHDISRVFSVADVG